MANPTWHATARCVLETDPTTDQLTALDHALWMWSPAPVTWYDVTTWTDVEGELVPRGIEVSLAVTGSDVLHAYNRLAVIVDAALDAVGLRLQPVTRRAPYGSVPADEIVKVFVDPNPIRDAALVTCTGWFCGQCGHNEAWHYQPHARPRHIYKPVAIAADRDDLLDAAAATMPEVVHSGEELPSPEEILNLPLHPNYEPGLGTIRGYLAALAAAVWDENEGFSGKRPFGNSGWSTDLEAALVQAGVIDGAFNERGYLEHADVKAADRLIRSAAKAMGHPSSPAPVVVSAKHSADRTQEEARAVLARFRDEGLLWLVNTSVLHPRGYALSIGVDDDRQPTGLLGVIDFGEYSCFDIAEIGDTFERYVRAEITREADRNGRNVPFPEEGHSSDE